MTSAALRNALVVASSFSVDSRGLFFGTTISDVEMAHFDAVAFRSVIPLSAPLSVEIVAALRSLYPSSSSAVDVCSKIQHLHCNALRGHIAKTGYVHKMCFRDMGT